MNKSLQEINDAAVASKNLFEVKNNPHLLMSMEKHSTLICLVALSSACCRYTAFGVNSVFNLIKNQNLINELTNVKEFIQSKYRLKIELIDFSEIFDLLNDRLKRKVIFNIDLFE